MTRRFVIPALLLVLTLGSGFVAGRVSADQPHMNAALEHLREARHSLEAAEADKGGHRAKAIDYTDRAIHEVERGMQYDGRH